MPAAQSLG